MGYLTNFNKDSYHQKDLVKNHYCMRSPGNRVLRCLWRHGIRKFCRIPQILWRHRQLWTRFPDDRLIVSRCGYRRFFVIFWALSDGYLDENWSSNGSIYGYGDFIRRSAYWNTFNRRLWKISRKIFKTSTEINVHYGKTFRKKIGSAYWPDCSIKNVLGWVTCVQVSLYWCMSGQQQNLKK